MICPICNSDFIKINYTSYESENKAWDKYYNTHYGEWKCPNSIDTFDLLVFSGHSIEIKFDDGALYSLRLTTINLNEIFHWTYYKEMYGSNKLPEIRCNTGKRFKIKEFAFNKEMANNFHELQSFK